MKIIVKDRYGSHLGSYNADSVNLNDVARELSDGRYVHGVVESFYVEDGVGNLYVNPGLLIDLDPELSEEQLETARELARELAAERA